MKEITFPTMVFIIVKILESKLSTCGLIDAGSEITIFKSFLLKEWEKTKISIKCVTGNKEKITKQKENVEIMIQNKIVKIGKVHQYNNIECDIILGNDFLQQFSIYQQTIYTIILKTPCDHWIRVPRILKPFRINYNQKVRKWRTEKINTSITYKITVQDTCKKLKENFSNNPLKYWEKTKIYCKLKMIDPDKVIRIQPMIYSQEGIEDFKIQINELIQMNLIRGSKSPHSSPAFMVRKQSKIKRGKVRMVINYKEVNKNTKFDEYYIPNKKILINLARGKNYYNKFDYKSGFWQIKMDNDSIPITTFSTPRGHYE